MKNRFTLAQPEALREFCRHHHIRRLALFGSVPRGEARPDSDLDVLVEFEPGHVPGLAFITIQDQLSELLGGRPVDLVTPKFLNPRVRDQVLAEAEVLYDCSPGRAHHRGNGEASCKP